MHNSNHPFWFYFSLALLALAAAVVIVITSIENSPRSAAVLANNYFQQEAGYIAGVTSPVATLGELVKKPLTPEQVVPLKNIREEILLLRVPSGYQDFHLNVVLKISQLEELLSESGYQSASSQTAIKRLQAELLVLVDEANNFKK